MKEVAGNENLVIRMGGLGDLSILSSSLLALKLKEPHHPVVLATKPENMSLLAGAECLDRVIPIEDYQQEKWFRIYDLRWAVEPPAIGPGKSTWEAYTTKDRSDIFDDLLGIRNGHKKFSVPVHQASAGRLGTLLARYRRPFVGIVVTGSTPIRCIPPEYLMPLADLLQRGGATPVLLGTTQLWCKDLADLKPPGINLIDTLSVREMVALVSVLDVLISPDTAPYHIAGALGKRCLALFGNIHPNTRITYYPTVRSLYPEGENPCIQHPCWDVPKVCHRVPDVFGANCMRLLTPERIYAAIADWLVSKIGMLTVITPTGDRPEAMSLLRRWMAAQTLQPAQWLIIDDGKKPLSSIPEAEIVRREPQSDDPPHTLCKNLEVAIPLVKYDKIVIMEDDDYYGPQYLRTMSNLLNEYELVGEAYAKYYHLPSKQFRRIGNTAHASLAQTAFRKSLLPTFQACLPGDPYVDMRFWRNASGKRHLIDDRENKLRLHCGLKGLGGRPGIGSGHDPQADYYEPDKDYKTLISWVGEQPARVYMGFEQGESPEQLITAVMVSYNSRDLLEKAFLSLRRHYFGLRLILVDGSTPDNPCREFVKSLDGGPFLKKILVDHNIGHGRGMVLGLEHCTTPFALLIDTDVIVHEPILRQMLALMEPDTLGVGCLHMIASDGHIHGALPHHKGQPQIPYLHPFFALINLENYRKYQPFVHHGAPCYKTMVDIYNQGLSQKILKQSPGLYHCGGELDAGRGPGPVEHKMKGTRKIMLEETKGALEIPQEWE